MNLEHFKKDDLQNYIDIATAFHNGPGSCTPANPEIFKKNFEKMMNSDEVVGYFLVEDEKRIGYVICSKMFSTEIGEYLMWIEELSIDDAYQNKGYGSKTFKLLEEKFPEVKRIRLEVAPTNDSAKKLYDRLGYSFGPYEQMFKNL